MLPLAADSPSLGLEPSHLAVNDAPPFRRAYRPLTATQKSDIEESQAKILIASVIFNSRWLRDGGRTRARTLDPLIKSQRNLS